MPAFTRALVLLAAIPLMGPISAHANEDPLWLSQCKDTGASSIECLSVHAQSLHDQQINQLEILRSALEAEGPEGTDFATAVATLDKTQAAWDDFAQSDCRMLDLVMGDFGGMAGESLFCLIEHYEARNAQLERWIARLN